MSRAGISGMTKILTYLRGFFAEAAKTVFSINNRFPDVNGNVDLPVVPAAEQLVTDNAQTAEGKFISRTTGGEASIGDGTAVMMRLRGNSVHTGYVAESLTMSLVTAERGEGEEPITAELDEDVFKSYVLTSGTTTLIYTSSWSADPALYGVTVTGTPKAGDTITIVYVIEDRGTITVATPTAFRSTGYNLYNHDLGYAYALDYSDMYGFIIGGTYTSLAYSETLDGAQTPITPASGYFSIPGDGYIWVTGGNDTDTEIYMTWSNWIEGRECAWSAYEETTIDLSDIIGDANVDAPFPNGMAKVNSVYDEIDMNAGLAIQRIERLAYTEGNLAAVIAAGREYEADTNYIYAVLDEPVQTIVDIDGAYDANDHGLEIFDDTTVGVQILALYGENLIDKLRTDVVTISEQSLTETQKAQIRTNLDVPSNNNIATLEDNVIPNLWGCRNGKVEVYSSDNANNFTDTGKCYYWAYGNTPSNATYVAGDIFVIRTFWGYVQFAFGYEGGMRTRTCYAGTWSGWA